MSWKIVYTETAKHDLWELYRYIAEELLVPETAVRQSQRIMQEIRLLNEMPFRHRLYHDEPWHSQGLRFFPIDNFLVFYLPEKNSDTVTIVRIMYKGRDIHRQLTETKLHGPGGG